MALAHEWLTLRAASALLGVHPTTLRQWSDEGRIVAVRTPGGHRRFARHDLERWLVAARGTHAPPATMLRAALDHGRGEIPAVVSERPWLAALDAAARERQRRAGRQLLGLMVQFVSRRRIEPSLLDEARAIGQAYGQELAAAGCPLIEATLAFVAFRDAMLESIFQLPDTSGLDRDEGGELRGRLNHFMHQVLRAMMEAHQATQI